MQTGNDNIYEKNQCSLVIRVEGNEIEIPVTFGMTADEIRMIYPFLLPLLNDKVLNPAVQFVKANEQGLLADLTDEEYRSELLRVTEQSKYWYDKPSAGILDIAIRFAVDVKMKGIADLDFIFNRSASYDPMKIKPLTEIEANTIMQKLRIDGTQDDLDVFANLGVESETAKDSTDEEIEKHEEVREKKAEIKENPFGDSESSVSDIPVSDKVNTSDIFKSIRSDNNTHVYDNVDEADENKYASKYDPNAKFSDSDIRDGRLTRFDEEDRIEDERKKESSVFGYPGVSNDGAYDPVGNDGDDAYTILGSPDYDDSDIYGEPQYDAGEPDSDDDGGDDDGGLDFTDFGDPDGEE